MSLLLCAPSKEARALPEHLQGQLWFGSGVRHPSGALCSRKGTRGIPLSGFDTWQRCFPWHGWVLPARPKSLQCPLGAMCLLLSPPRANSPPPAPQIGVAEAGLQRAILKRAQEILAVAKTIPGITRSFPPGV